MQVFYEQKQVFQEKKQVFHGTEGTEHVREANAPGALISATEGQNLLKKLNGAHFWSQGGKSE